jgi:hypothetical protein
MPYTIQVRVPADERNYHAVDGPWSDQWRDIEEGAPCSTLQFDTREEAEEFAAAEVGSPYRIVGDE